MARSYARIQLAVWADKDFRALTVEAQHLFFLLISQPALNYAGVLPYQPKRWQRLASNMTPEGGALALAALEAGGFILTDPDEEEVWVCSFPKHESLGHPNTVKAMWSAYRHIGSERIRDAFTADYGDGTEPDATATSTRPLPDESGTSTHISTSKHGDANPTSTRLVPDESRGVRERDRERGKGSSTDSPQQQDVAAAACKLLAERAQAINGKGSGWVHAAAKGKLSDYAAQIAAFVIESPEGTAEQLAEYLEPQQQLARIPGPADRPECDTCESSGTVAVIEDGALVQAFCPDCNNGSEAVREMLA